MIGSDDHCPKCEAEDPRKISWWIIIIIGTALKWCSLLLILWGIPLVGIPMVIAGFGISMLGRANLVTQTTAVNLPIEINRCRKCGSFWITGR